ncbi:MAG TPA: hypothetical protein VFH73_07580 [Polyangia bacterium]|jgi:hypothetical protein|nr:hypothetical protein [Polyangia bacterium]
MKTKLGNPAFLKVFTGPVAAGALALILVALSSRPSRADIVAAYLEGHGGMSSSDGQGSGGAASASVSAPGLGFQLGARLLIFEGYIDRTSFGDGMNASRAVLGLRAGLGLGGFRLVLRGGAGALAETGGALTGPYPGVPNRSGVVARAGLALETRLAPLLWGGFGVDGEYFTLGNDIGGSVGSSRIQGSDIFASIKLLFEIGI